MEATAREVAIDDETPPMPPAPGDFEAFHRAEADGLYRALVLAVGDPELGREATDEALARAYQHWRRIGRYDNPAGWAYRVGLNWARNRLRKRSREVLTDAVPGTGETVPGTDVWLDDALAALPLEVRAVVVLRYYLDWPTARVADALGIPQGTVKSRLAAGRGALARALEEDR